jgi:NADP-reducing hydrogenase subunit HndD
VVLQVAPACRVSAGEPFGDESGTSVTGKIVSAARRLGFSFVYDTIFGADMTVLEESDELIEHIKGGRPKPMFTSCCPGWMTLVRKWHPELLPNCSSCKSPHMMVGAAVKAFFRERRGIEDVFVVSMMPCTTTKNERLQGADVDAVLTTREFAG